MSERYWITGAQIGTLKALIDEGKIIRVAGIFNEVEENQFIGNMEEPYDEHEIVIKRKESK